MEAWCPQAWLLNLTNPMTQICWAATRETTIRTIGICHEITHFAQRIAGVLEVNQEEIWFQAAGINHLPWISRFQAGSRDGLALLREWLAEHGPLHLASEAAMGTPWSVFNDRHAVKFTLFQGCGALAGAGDRHVAEFFPHFLRPETNWGLAYGVEPTSIEHRIGMYTQQAEQVQCWLTGEDRVPLRHSPEQVGPLIAALEGGPAGRFIVNIPNQGQVPNLPAGAVVECYARVDGYGVHPEFPGPLPAMPAAVCNWHLAEMELTLDAAIAGDRALALQALRMDPTVPHWAAAEAMLDELLAATAEWLPQFGQG
jgi:alpha-galactosidase